MTSVAGLWLPVDVVLDHFRAVDSLGLSAEVAFEIGAGSGKRIQESVLSTLVRLAAGADANPWTVFQNYGRLWRRIFDGGTFRIDRPVLSRALRARALRPRHRRGHGAARLVGVSQRVPPVHRSHGVALISRA